MAGYVSPDGKVNFAASPDGHTVFSRTLQELRSVVTDMRPPVNVVFRQVATEVGPPFYNDLELSKASISRGLYNGRETNLAGAINAFAKPLGGGPAGADGAGSPARFHILITDGVQSTSAQQADISCSAGSDYRCVKNNIWSLLRGEWAGAVLGVRSEFRGKVYSELKKGHVVAHESTRGDLATYRPFYLYIFSPQPAALDDLVRAIKDRLRPVLREADAIREYALTQPYSSGPAESTLSIPPGSSDALETTKAKEADPPRHTLRVDVNTERSGPKPLTLTVKVPWSAHAADSGTPQELASALNWELTEVNVEGDGSEQGAGRVRYPELRIKRQEADGEGRCVLELYAWWPPGTGDLRWRAYRLWARPSPDVSVPSWVESWSTNVDTSAADAGKTLNLESSLSGLWRNPVTEKQVAAEVYVRVGPL